MEWRDAGLSKYDRLKYWAAPAGDIVEPVVLLARLHLLVSHHHALLVVPAGHDVDDEPRPHLAAAAGLSS